MHSCDIHDFSFLCTKKKNTGWGKEERKKNVRLKSGSQNVSQIKIKGKKRQYLACGLLQQKEYYFNEE